MISVICSNICGYQGINTHPADFGLKLLRAFWTPEVRVFVTSLRHHGQV